MIHSVIQIIAAVIGAVGFSIVFGIRHRYIWVIALNAGLSWTLYLVCCIWLNDFWSNLLTAAFCSLFAAVAARFMEVPTVVMQMPATVPMIPGGSLYYTVYYAMEGDRALFGSCFQATFRTIFAMAIGFALTEVILRQYGGRLTGAVERIKSAVNFQRPLY